LGVDLGAAEKPVVEELPPEQPTGFQPLAGPRGVADDLKKLPGVSGAVEKQLNDLGVFHYSQLAELNEADAAKIGEEVGLPGRIQSWIAKAKEFVAE
jgi:small subunit ribosomal protein S2